MFYSVSTNFQSSHQHRQY